MTLIASRGSQLKLFPETEACDSEQLTLHLIKVAVSSSRFTACLSPLNPAETLNAVGPAQFKVRSRPYLTSEPCATVPLVHHVAVRPAETGARPPVHMGRICSPLLAGRGRRADRLIRPGLDDLTAGTVQRYLTALYST